VHPIEELAAGVATRTPALGLNTERVINCMRSARENNRVYALQQELLLKQALCGYSVTARPSWSMEDRLRLFVAHYAEPGTPVRLLVHPGVAMNWRQVEGVLIRRPDVSMLHLMNSDGLAAVLSQGPRTIGLKIKLNVNLLGGMWALSY